MVRGGARPPVGGQPARERTAYLPRRAVDCYCGLKGPRLDLVVIDVVGGSWSRLRQLLLLPHHQAVDWLPSRRLTDVVGAAPHCVCPRRCRTVRFTDIGASCRVCQTSGLAARPLVTRNRVGSRVDCERRFVCVVQSVGGIPRAEMSPRLSDPRHGVSHSQPSGGELGRASNLCRVSDARGHDDLDTGGAPGSPFGPLPSTYAHASSKARETSLGGEIGCHSPGTWCCRKRQLSLSAPCLVGPPPSGIASPRMVLRWGPRCDPTI
jgi:hypothetical protein